MRKKKTVEEEILQQLKMQNGLANLLTKPVVLWTVLGLVAWSVLGILFVGITGIGR